MTRMTTNAEKRIGAKTIGRLIWWAYEASQVSIRRVLFPRLEGTRVSFFSARTDSSSPDLLLFMTSAAARGWQYFQWAASNDVNPKSKTKKMLAEQMAATVEKSRRRRISRARPIIEAAKLAILVRVIAGPMSPKTSAMGL